MDSISYFGKFKTGFFLILFLGMIYSLPAQNGVWIEQILQPSMNGNWMADRGENCLGYTKTTSRYFYFFDINSSQWVEVDLSTTQTFRDVEAAGQTVMAYSDDLIIGYSAATSQWDTVHYQGNLLNSTGPGILRSYGCGEKLAYFVTNSYFYVFDSELGAWQSHNYLYPGAALGGNFWSGDDYAGAILHQNTPNYPLNMVYSLPQHAFNENLQGGYYYHSDWGMSHGFVTSWSDAISTYVLTGYCSQTNQFSAKTLIPPFGSYEGGNCLFPDNFSQKTVAVFHYREFLSEARLLAYDTQQGQWYEASHYYDPQYYTGLGWWHYGGRVAGTSQYHLQTRAQTYLLFNGADGTYNTITPGIYYCGSIPGGANAGGNYIMAYDTTMVWFYNPANQSSHYVNKPWPNPTGMYLGDYFATHGSYKMQGDPVQMHIFNATTNNITNISPGNSYGITVRGSHNMCGFTAGAGHSEVYFYSGLTDTYSSIFFPPNSYPGLLVGDRLAVASTGSEGYLYDATSNSLFHAPYQLSTYLIGKEVAFFSKNNYAIDAYSTLFQQLTEFAIPEGINAAAVSDYLGLVASVGFSKYYIYNGFYNNLVPLQPTGIGQSHLVGGKTAIVIRLDRIYAFDPQAPTGLHTDPPPISRFHLAQNYPNPFNPVTHIEFELRSRGQVNLRIYDVLGRELVSLVNKMMPAGVHRADWQAGEYPSGVYYCRLETGGFSETKKMILLR